MATKRQGPLPLEEGGKDAWRKTKRPATRQACAESPELTQAQSPQVTPQHRRGGGCRDVNTVVSNNKDSCSVQTAIPGLGTALVASGITILPQCYTSHMGTPGITFDPSQTSLYEIWGPGSHAWLDLQETHPNQPSPTISTKSQAC